MQLGELSIFEMERGEERKGKKQWKITFLSPAPGLVDSR
jgi:hypothetical protein